MSLGKILNPKLCEWLTEWHLCHQCMDVCENVTCSDARLERRCTNASPFIISNKKCTDLYIGEIIQPLDPTLSSLLTSEGHRTLLWGQLCTRIGKRRQIVWKRSEANWNNHHPTKEAFSLCEVVNVRHSFPSSLTPIYTLNKVTLTAHVTGKGTTYTWIQHVVVFQCVRAMLN